MPTATNEVLPLQALHYDPHQVEEIGQCLAQPYDVISPAMQDAYYEQHPYNVIRLILGRRHAGDTETDNRYTRAAATLGDWLARGVLRRATRPSFWVYEQRFSLPQAGSRRVTGLIARVRLHDYAAGVILPHEQVMGGVVEDRLRLTRTTGTQMEYIWSIYREPTGAIDRLLGRATKTPPLIDHDERPQGVRHRLWRLADAPTLDTISRTLRGQLLFIADGHHRYHTMLQFRDEMRRRCPAAGPHAPWEFILMFLVNSDHQELTILPIHRLLHGAAVTDVQELERRLTEHFVVRRYRHRDGGREAAARSWLRNLAQVASGEHKLGIYPRGSDVFLGVTLRESAGGAMAGDGSPRWRQLDVNVLNVLVLRRIFGVTEAELDDGERVSYTNSAGEALAAVDGGRADLAVLMNPTALHDVLAVAKDGERLPRKSTFFHPKPLSGLLFYLMEERTAALHERVRPHSGDR